MQHAFIAGAPTAQPGDEIAVVDPATMRVHGVDGLRVVDASVFPYVTNGNIYAPVMMVAEKAADMIRRDTPLPPGAKRKAHSGGAHPVGCLGADFAAFAIGYFSAAIFFAEASHALVVASGLEVLGVQPVEELR